MFGKLFKPRAHYVFDYKPRYYNERKERLQKLEEKYHGKESEDENEPRIRLTKNNLKNDWVKNKRSATDRSANLRLAIIIALLVGLVAYILEIHTLF
jgi:Flp pilus assembly protein TadB